LRCNADRDGALSLVGNFVTSLDMAGCTVTVSMLDGR
jgi:dihydroxyacetone kinase